MLRRLITRSGQTTTIVHLLSCFKGANDTILPFYLSFNNLSISNVSLVSIVLVSMVSTGTVLLAAAATSSYCSFVIIIKIALKNTLFSQSTEPSDEFRFHRLAYASIILRLICRRFSSGVNT